MLKVTCLSKDFKMHVRDGLVIEGFQGVSFTAHAGELLAITGASGIGKSALLKCIYRTYIPTEGSVVYKDRSGKGIDLAVADEQTVLRLRKTDIGYVSQFLHVIPRISALDILTERRLPAAASPREAQQWAEMHLDRVGIDKNLWNMYPSTFSGGEKQRLNILMALASKPRLLLLDEPTASLDPHSKEIILELVKEAKEKGTTMIGIFHDRESVHVLADNRFDMKRKQQVAVS